MSPLPPLPGCSNEGAGTQPPTDCAAQQMLPLHARANRFGQAFTAGGILVRNHTNQGGIGCPTKRMHSALRGGAVSRCAGAGGGRWLTAICELMSMFAAMNACATNQRWNETETETETGTETIH